MKSILYIMSDTRSGSTLLENILSKSAEMVSVGEIYHLNSFLNFGRWGSLLDWACTCGQRFRDCSFWSRILDKAMQNGTIDLNHTEISRKKGGSPLAYASCAWERNADNMKVLQTLKSVFEAIFEETGCACIIDSSKEPTQGLAMYQSLGIPVKVVYLKRDIRAVSFSKDKWSQKLWKQKNSIYKIVLFSKLYDMRCKNALSAIADEDKIEIRYEDLAADPQTAVDAITEKFGYHRFETPEYMYVDNDHTVGGTPTNRDGSKRKIQYDDAWEKKVQKYPLFNISGYILDKI